MAKTFETNANLKGSRFRFIDNQEYIEDGDVTYFYAPRQIEVIDYDDNISLQYNGFYTLPVLAYRIYRSVFGPDARRLWWVILEYSKIRSLTDVVTGTILTMPSPNRIKDLLK